MSNNRRKTNEAAEEAKVEEVAEALPDTVEEKDAAVEKTEAKSRPRMYVGPTVTDFAIQNRVYTDIPDTAKAKIKEQPELGNLFIEILDYPKANKMIRERSGYIFSAYTKALALRTGGK